MALIAQSTYYRLELVDLVRDMLQPLLAAESISKE
jgi:hypothetical protein